MPIVIENFATTVNLQDENKIRRIVREEIARRMEGSSNGGSVSKRRVDPADPAAAGKVFE